MRACDNAAALGKRNANKWKTLWQAGSIILYHCYMARADAVLHRYEIFFAAAAIAAHASLSETGFRQRDVRFLIELFTNWVDLAAVSENVILNNTQIQRYLDSLCWEGYARKITREKIPKYRLTRIGLLELLSRLSHRTGPARPQHFFFLYYFLCNYRSRLIDLIRQEGKQFPSALRIEIESLLDHKRVLREEIKRADLEQKKWEERSREALKSAQLAAQLFGKNVPLAEAVQKIEKLYPYELNSQKPLSELIAAIPEEMAAWELAVGNKHRVEQLYGPSRGMISAYRDLLLKLDKAS